MNHVDRVIKHEVYPQKMHLCSKNFRGISVFKHIVAALSVRPSVRPKPFLQNPWTEFDKTSYMNSLGYCTDEHFPVFQFDALSWKKGA